MSADIMSWLVHPVTLTLVAVLLGLLFTVLEILLKSLAEMGNVRFQGMLEDHQVLLPVDAESSFHLSQLVDVLRWLQLGAVGLLWLVLSQLQIMGRMTTLAVAVLLPASLVLISRLVFGAVGEDTVATLLRSVKPLVAPGVRLLVKMGPGAQEPQPEGEDEEASEREIQAYLEAGQAAGIFEEDEGEIVESLVDFFDTVVREVMTPRTDMVAVPDTASVEEVLDLIAETHMSRVPVYHDTVDSITGMVHVKNVVKQLRAGQPVELNELTHDCLVVPESKALGELLRDFQSGHQQMAIVVDEYGGTSGLVTLEDILEEIVGEIQDEHEPSQPPEVLEIGPGVYRLQGRAPLEVLGELYGLNVDDIDIDTVGGLVFSGHGTVPETGTEVEDQSLGLLYSVDDMDERRIVSVTVRRLDREAPEKSDGGT